MNVSLTPELERWVSEKVDGGRYKSASEVVREGLRLLQEKEEEHAARLAALRGEPWVEPEEMSSANRRDDERAVNSVLDRVAGLKASSERGSRARRVRSS